MPRLLFLALLLCASVASAAGWNKPGQLEPDAQPRRFTIVAADTTGDKVGLDVTQCGQLQISSYMSSGTIELYLVPTETSATTTGELIYVTTLTDLTPTYVDVTSPAIRPRITSQGDGWLAIRCTKYERMALSTQSLKDVARESPTDGEVLVWSAAEGKYRPGAGGGGGGGGGDASGVTYGPGDLADWLLGDPGNVDDALDVLADRLRGALAALGEWDRVVDLDAGIVWNGVVPTTYSNRALAIQEAINPYFDQCGSIGGFSVKVFGDATFQWADAFDQGPFKEWVAFAAGCSSVGTGGTGGYSSGSGTAGWPIRTTTVVAAGMNGRTATGGDADSIFDADDTTLANEANKYVEVTAGACAGQKRQIASASATAINIPGGETWTACTPDATTVYRIFTVPARTGGSQKLHVHFENVFIQYNQSGQDDRFALFHLGNCFMAGATTAASAECQGMAGNTHFTGTLRALGQNEVASTGWVAGRAPVLNSNFLDADRGGVIWWMDGYTRSQIDMYFNFTAASSNFGSDDTICFLTYNTWGTNYTAGGRLNSCGVGAQFLGNNVGQYARFYIAGGNTGFINGNVSQNIPNFGTSSATGYTGSSNSESGTARLESWIVEGNKWVEMAFFTGGSFSTRLGFEVNHLYTEPWTFTAASLVAHEMIIGAGQCDNADPTTVGRIVAESYDCGAGAAVFPVNPHFGILFNGGWTPSITHVRFAGLIFGNGFTENSGLVQFSNISMGQNVIPANDATADGCSAAATPYFFCQANNSNPSVIFAYRMPRVGVGIDSVIRFNSATASAPGSLYWPYQYVTSDDSFELSWSADEVNLTTSDCLTPSGVASRNCSTSYADAHEWAYPWHVTGNANATNVYIKECYGVTGSYSDAGEANESMSFRVQIGDGESQSANPVLVGPSFSFTEGTENAGDVSAMGNVNTNTMLFDCSTGTCKQWSRPLFGVRMSFETDVGSNNLNKVSVTCRFLRNLAND